MTRSRTPRLLLLAAAFTLAVQVYALLGTLPGGIEPRLELWFMPAVFLGSGLATLAAARRSAGDRLPWLLLGAGLVLYASGSVAWNVTLTDAGAVPFPSAADALWLALYPMAFAAMALLVRRHYTHVSPSVLLDGVIGGLVLGAFIAAVVFEPIFDVTVRDGVGALARLGYTLGDLVPLAFVVVVWCLSGSRLPRPWALIGLGFGMLVLGDAVYVVEAALGSWAPGGTQNLLYGTGTMLLAGAAWAGRDDDRVYDHPAPVRVAVPSGFALAAVALCAYGVVSTLNPLAIALTLVTLLAVVLRFGLALLWLTRQRAEFANLAATDALTGVANHRALHERYAEELGRARRLEHPISVVALDIDHFKAINDTYGHSEGDEVLQRIARALSAEARAYDTLGRVGGEEFALILPEVGPDEAVAIAERCRDALGHVFVHGEPVRCSAGVASFPADTDDGHRLLEMADGALYQAKQSGRDQVRRYDARDVLLLSGIDQQEQVREVLAHRDAISIVFQPIVELTTGRIAGYEALSRFPTAKPVRPPDVWFAQARRCGLGNRLEARAIARALAVPGRPEGTFLTLNASPAALLSHEVARVLPDDLTDIVIELTEDELFSADPGLDDRIAELRGRGALIAVDDAGAGYAGLQQLIRVKPDILKLDRSLVQDLHDDPSKRALLESLSRFAVTTGAVVCAEGIEKVEELRALAHYDVTYAQGYALGRPAPAWPAVAADVAGVAASEQRWGMRVVHGGAPATGYVSYGDVADAFARVRSRADLREVVALVRRMAQADEVAVSKVLPGERCIETLHDLSFTASGELFSFDDFPTTERVIVEQVLGQIVDGDAAADPAELALLRAGGHRAILLVPVLFRGETVGLFELYRKAARPWTASEIDQARMLAHHFGAALGTPAALA